MEVFRVSKRQYQQDLIGTGAYLAGGRWNTVGNYMLYTAASRSLAILEVLVHISRNRPLDDYSVVVLHIPDNLFVDAIDPAALSENWRELYSQTQPLGDQWLSGQPSLSLRVPSAIVKAEYNYLLNPNHEAFKLVKVLDYEPIQFDERFFGH
ncbi:RES family NAD+ phosphorylase [Spirosoma jeollabukense]